ncbi:MAG: DEAD/DEAH box helicase family protein [Myxococcota bacterium]
MKCLVKLGLILTFAWAVVAEEVVKLLPHQETAINYLLNHPEQKGLLINHYMGTGKTFLAIGFAEKFPDTPVIVLAPRFIEGHWLQQMKQFGIGQTSRFEFVSYQDAPEKLKHRDLSGTIVILDEAHNLVRFIKSPNLEQNKRYSSFYLKLQGAKRILALTGTPIYNNEFDLAVLVNLVSGSELFPYNEENFREIYTEVIPNRSFWRGYFTESMIVRNSGPMAVAVAAGALSPIAIVPVLALSMISFPVINNALLPVQKFPLRQLNAERLQHISERYISYYEIPKVSQSDFPGQTRHEMQVDYDADQFEFFLNFAEMSLNENKLYLLMREESPDIDLEYIRLNSSILQQHLRRAPGAGRDIGNLGDAPPKFQRVLKAMTDKGLQKTVIYSNYFENGVKIFADYLEKNGLGGKYAILLPSANAAEQSRLVAEYNSGAVPILLLHPEITEGISLRGTRQFHVLEPVLNSTILEQVIGRAVRYRSHLALPEAERHVDIYLWQSVLGSFNLKNFELKKANWLAKYRELSDWADFGRGITQIDKNYDFKLYSPDEYAYMRLGDLNQNIQILKDVLKEHAIESNRLTIDEKTYKPSRALPYPTTNLTAGYFFTPKIQWLGKSELQSLPEMRSDVSFRIGIEVPLYRYLNAGAHVSYIGYQFYNQDAKMLVLGTALDMKAQYPLEFGRQRIAPYLTGSLGIVGVVDINVLRPYSKTATGKEIGYLGMGASSQLMSGLEYYPVPLIGIFAEGGIHAMIATHRVTENSEATWEMDSYFLHAWQIQFGLKLGF